MGTVRLYKGRHWVAFSFLKDAGEPTHVSRSRRVRGKFSPPSAFLLAALKFKFIMERTVFIPGGFSGVGAVIGVGDIHPLP